MKNRIFENLKTKKIIISIVFGIIGFTINMFPIRIYSYQNINIDILIGLAFPLFISMIWGWKYGLISALSGGCQTLWFIWNSDGYGLLYSVPIFTLWIFWHGFMSDYRMKLNNYRWYRSVYITELVFRIFSELGFLTLFRWLISHNPPFWNSSVTVTTISNEWMYTVIAKHIVLSLLYLFLIRIIINIKPIKKAFNIQNSNVKGDSIIIGSILFAILLIVFETIGCTYISNNGMTFIQNFFQFSDKQLYTRGIMFFSSIIAGIILTIFYQKIQFQKNNILEILYLTERIGEKANKKVDINIFLSDLLKTSLKVIEEADFGIVVYYEDDKVIFTDVSGHDKKLEGFRMKSFMDDKTFSGINKIHNGKKVLLDKSSINEEKIINKYMKASNESLVMILSNNHEKIAGLVLEKRKGVFSKESIDRVKVLRNIPVAYFSQLYNNQEKRTMFEGLIHSIIKMLSLHNDYTKKHSMNVANIAKGIAEVFGLNKNQIQIVYWTGLVHDIGKILISDNILDKKGSLTDSEWKVVKKHPEWGYETLRDNESTEDIAEYVLYHHERWDGKGYPKGISGENIPLISRIISVGDAFDAMTNTRPYRRPIAKKEALDEILKNSGSQFDPNIVQVFINYSDRIIDKSEN